MEEKYRFNKIKLDQLRNDIQAGIAGGDAGTLDADEIKRRGRARHTAALRDTVLEADSARSPAATGGN